METQNGFMETQNGFMEISRNIHIFANFSELSYFYIFSEISRNFRFVDFFKSHFSELTFTYRYLGGNHQKRKNAFLTMPCGGAHAHSSDISRQTRSDVTRLPAES